MIAVAGAIAVAATAFRKLTADTVKHTETIDDLVRAYDEATGAVVRLNLEEARAEAARVNRGKLRIIGTTNVGGVPVPMLGRISTTEELTDATKALDAAQRAYDDWWNSHHKPNTKGAIALERERTDGLRAMGRELSQNLDLFGGGFLEQNLLRLQKQLMLQRQVKAEIEATAEAQRNALRAGLDKAGMGDVKDRALGDREAMVAASQNAADSIAGAFVNQFRDRQQDFAQVITQVLRNAIQEAIAKLIVQNLFRALFSAVTGGAGGKGGGSGTGGFISNIFGAPSASSAMGSPTTVVVPLSSMPRALTPIEQSRDAMWQSVYTETARALQGNNVRLAVR